MFQIGKVIFKVFVLATIGVSVGCTKSNMSSSISQSGPIRIGEVGSMTGSDATFGVSTHHGITIAVDEINSQGGIRGRKIELISLDDQGKSSEAVLAITKLITQEKVQAVLGEVASSLSIAMAAIAQKSKVPMITPSSINSKVTLQGDYVFRVCFLDSFQSKVMSRFAWDHLHAKRAAILRDVKSDYSQDSAHIFAEDFKKRGGEIVIEQSYTGGDIDFKSQLTAIRSVQPDVILVPGYYTEIALIARQKQELGINAPLLGGDGWDSPKLKEIGGSSLAGSYFVSHFSQDDSAPHIQKFVQKYKEQFGVSPDGLAALGYDAAMVLFEAIRKTNSDSREQLKEAIAATQSYVGVTGKISLDSNRNAVKPAVVFKLDGSGNPKSQVLINASDL